MALLPRLRVIPDRTAVNIDWLVRLRWAEIVGQSATVLVSQVVFGIALPIVPLLAVVGIGLLSNLALEVRLGRGESARRAATDLVPGAPAGPAASAEVRAPGSFSEGQLAAVMALDILLLTALLFFTGGPSNPFGSLYLVQIALATVMVRAVWIWMLVVLSFTCYGVLLLVHQPLLMPDAIRMFGTWVALGVASAFVVHFLLRITGALAAREAELAAARHLAARQERLASLATMAAGAAHELSTPLGTVALAAKELERALTSRLLARSEAGAPIDGGSGVSEPGAAAPPREPMSDPLIEDARLIREQVGRCRSILDQMAQGAGTIGESLAQVTVRELIEEAATGARPHPSIHREQPDAVAALPLEVPRRAVASALRSLLTNAQDASASDQAVVVRVRTDGGSASAERSATGPGPGGAEPGPQVVITITDRGAGMDADVLSRIGEPFYTTKAPGRGMGLGMFLARAVVEGVGGTLQIESVRGRGTTVQVTLPQSPVASPSALSSKSSKAWKST